MPLEHMFHFPWWFILFLTLGPLICLCAGLLSLVSLVDFVSRRRVGTKTMIWFSVPGVLGALISTYIVLFNTAPNDRMDPSLLLLVYALLLVPVFLGLLTRIWPEIHPVAAPPPTG